MPRKKQNLQHLARSSNKMTLSQLRRLNCSRWCLGFCTIHQHTNRPVHPWFLRLYKQSNGVYIDNENLTIPDMQPAFYTRQIFQRPFRSSTNIPSMLFKVQSPAEEMGIIINKPQINCFVAFLGSAPLASYAALRPGTDYPSIPETDSS